MSQVSVIRRSTGKTLACLAGPVIFLCCLAALATNSLGWSELGRFTGSGDVGTILHPGSVQFDGSTGEYRVTGSGANIWGSRDAFYFVWNQLEGDLRLKADVRLVTEGGALHRKAGWMIRATQDEGSPFVAVMAHGDGLISMQVRRTQGGPVAGIQSVTKAPATLLLDRDASVFTVTVLSAGELEPVGAVQVDLPEKPYVGLAVCSHDANRLEEAVFSNVSIENRVALPQETRVYECSLETIDVESGRRRLVYRALKRFEAPNWTVDGRDLIYNQEGRLFRLPVTGGEPKMVDTGFADRCNNDHGLSPDGKWLAISHVTDRKSKVYVLPSTGGEPRLITPEGPSYWHGWSPDGKTLAYCGKRGEEMDIYTIPVNGGQETRLTTAPGLDDGPDYTPDGKFIYLNSERTGLMKIWRNSPDGSLQEQVTLDQDYADWFPHPSPDGKQIVFLSFGKEVKGHPANQEVVLRLAPIQGGKPRILAQLFGGQGTINVPSWSPDSKRIAFVSYRQVLPPRK